VEHYQRLCWWVSFKIFILANISIITGNFDDEALSILRDSPDVEYIEEDGYVRATTYVNQFCPSSIVLVKNFELTKLEY
jgi:hypothetical protein